MRSDLYDWAYSTQESFGVHLYIFKLAQILLYLYGYFLYICCISAFAYLFFISKPFNNKNKKSLQAKNDLDNTYTHISKD